MILFVLYNAIDGVQVGTTRLEVLPGSAAEVGGVRNGDRLVRVGSEPITEFSQIAPLIQQRPAMPTEVEVERAGRRHALTVTPSAEGRLGVRPQVEKHSVGLLDNLKRALPEPLRIVGAMFRGYVGVAAGTERAQVSGPVGIVRATERDERGGGRWLYLAGFLSALFWPGLFLLEGMLAVGMWLSRRRPADGVSGP